MEFQIYTDEDKYQFLNALNHMNYPLKVKIDNIFKGRSLAQNKYYHYVKKLCADHLGMTPTEMHKEFLKMFALIEEKPDENGEMKCVVESTAGMNTLRFEQYLENIKRWMLTIHGFYVPDPNEVIDDTNELKLKII